MLEKKKKGERELSLLMSIHRAKGKEGRGEGVITCRLHKNVEKIDVGEKKKRGKPFYIILPIKGGKGEKATRSHDLVSSREGGGGEKKKGKEKGGTYPLKLAFYREEREGEKKKGAGAMACLPNDKRGGRSRKR